MPITTIYFRYQSWLLNIYAIVHGSGTVTNGENNRLEDGLDEDEDTQRRRKRSKKNVVKDGNDQAGVHQFHPLKIILCIYDDETLEDKALKLVNLRFEYSVKLNVVYVGVEDVEEGLDDDILCNLFPDDTGLTLPHQVHLCIDILLLFCVFIQYFSQFKSWLNVEVETCLVDWPYMIDYEITF